MNNKKTIFSIVLSLIIAFAMIFGITLNTQAKTVSAENEEYIKFDVRVENEESISVPAGYAGALAVTYTVTETTGVDALQLRLGYDHTAFTLTGVTTNNATTLGTATKGQEGYLENVVYENTNTEGTAFVLAANDEDVLLITATFALNNPTPATAYTFNLYNANDEEELNISYSTAWRIDTNAQTAETATHAPVEIQYVNEAIVYVQGTYNFSLTGNTKTYDGEKAQDSEITITETGTHAPTLNLVWFDANYNKLEENPTNVGTYYVVAETEGNEYWQAYAGYTGNENDGYTLTDVEGKVATYIITAQAVNVTIDNKSSAYGEALVALTHNGAEYLGINLSTTADNTVPGTYPITGTASNANYTVNFTNGTYTITKKSVTVTIADKSSAYGAQLAELTHNGAAALGVTLSTTATSSSNVGTYPITGDWTDKTNYDVTFVNGTYTITSVGKTADYVKSFFSGATITYDAEEHNLLVVDGEKPNWISYTASNNNQTHANTYLIAVTATVSEQDAKNYIDATLVGDQEYVTAVYGTINPYAVTVTADDKSHVYGNTPATLTPLTVGVNNEVDVTFTVKANEETITLSTTTPVGTYSIVPSATNTNYAFTFNNGTYTVTKEDATISISAEDIIYNRALDYTVSNAKVGTLDAEYTIEIRNSNNEVVTGVLPVGDYTIYAIVADTDNYDGATDSAEFSVIPNVVGLPEVTYNKDKATWTAVTKDTFGNDLYNTTVTYQIGGENYDNTVGFTATSAGSYVLQIISSNENYLLNQVTLNVYSVTFTGGSHPASSTAEVEGLPATQYRFEGETATQPQGTPTVTGYTFNGWDFNFETEIEEDTEIPALWTIGQRTMTVVYVHSANNTYVETSKTFNVNYNSNVVINTSNFIEKANITDIIAQYNLNGMRYTFNGFWNYKITGEDEYIRENVTDIVVNATENYTFVARYTATPIVYDITYFYSFDGADYTPYTIENAAYGSTINYLHVASRKWFRAEAWYLDAERTQAAPETMPAHDITVYGALVFNVGKGDVNGDGLVNANDITLYRRWIVGGYEITELLNNEALYEASELETEDPSDTVYFIARVADTNAATYEAEVLGDGSTDIRDVSTIRMGMVGGYGFSIVEGKAVTGEDLIIARDFVINDASDVLMLAATGAKVVLESDIEEPNFVAEILDSNKDIIIDLNGHTLTLKSFRVTLAQGNTGKILVTNGRINVADGNGVYLTAVDGSVHLDDVTLYDDNGLFVIQTANHSLHLFNIVRFLKRNIENPADPLPAEVLVVKDSHIVVEEQATLTIDKVVVAEIVEVEEEQQIVEHVVPVQQESDAQITISNNSAQVAEVEVQGNVSYGISNYNELVEAAENGGEYTLFANIDCGNHDIVTSHNLTIDLNGYDITFAKWGFEVNNGATLTLNGDGNVTARACALYAQNGGKLVVNGGTYTSTNNPVIATHGNEGRGGNTITINGGEFNAGIITEGYVACGICTSNNDTVVVNAGTFNIENGVGIVARSGNTTVAENVVINITGNEIEGHILDSKHALIPSGKELVIDYASNYPGGTPVLTNNTEYEVYVVGNIVVTNEQELRTALANKVMAIVFGNDIVVTGTGVDDRLSVTANTNLNLNGKTLRSADGLEPTSNFATLWVVNGAVANITNGTIGSCYDSDGVTDAPYGIYAQNGTVNLTDVNVYGATTAIQVRVGEVNIYSGNYQASPYNDDYRYTLNCIDADYQAGRCNINVYGGSFTHFNPQGSTGENPTANFVAEGYTVQQNGDVYTVVEVMIFEGSGQGAQGDPGLD